MMMILILLICVTSKKNEAAFSLSFACDKIPQQIENLQFYFRSAPTIFWVTSSPTLIQGPQFSG